VNPRRFLQVVTGNALALAALYLAIGVVVEGLRVQWPSAGVLRVSYALDALPARILDRLGLLGPLKAVTLLVREIVMRRRRPVEP